MQGGEEAGEVGGSGSSWDLPAPAHEKAHDVAVAASGGEAVQV